MNIITFQPTPFRTVHSTATQTFDFGVPSGAESQLKGQQTRLAKPRGLGEIVTRRTHVVGDTVTVFSIYRKAV